MLGEHRKSRHAGWRVGDLGGTYSYTLVVLKEQKEACCSNLHREQSVALAKPVDAHDATTGGMVAVQRW